jgi:hypothetical protein
MPFTTDFESNLPSGLGSLPVVDIFQYWWLLLIARLGNGVTRAYYTLFTLNLPILTLPFLLTFKFMSIFKFGIQRANGQENINVRNLFVRNLFLRDILVRLFYITRPWFWYPIYERYIRRYGACRFSSLQIDLRCWFTSGGCYTSFFRMVRTLSTTTFMRGVSIAHNSRIYSSTTITSVYPSQTLGTMRRHSKT